MIRQGQNTGVIEAQPSATDFMAGGETGIIREIRVEDGNWIPYQPPGEWQKDMQVGFDTESCMSFAANDVLETFGDFMLKNSQYSPENMAWLAEKGYFNPDGTLNFSDSFTAKMSGTNEKTGNSFPAVWNSIRNNGLVPESVWPSHFDEINKDPNNAWNIYMQEIPADVIALGKEFLTRFTVLSEWVFTPYNPATPARVQEELKVAPLHICTEVCWPWNTSDIIKACGPGSQHGTMLSAVESDNYAILDHYNPFQKHLALDYTITYAMRGVFLDKDVSPKLSFSYVFNVNLAEGAPAEPEVKALQTALQTVLRPDGTHYMRPGIFGPYGPQTRRAVALFQADHHISDNGTHFGPQTRAALNAALSGH